MVIIRAINFKFNCYSLYPHPNPHLQSITIAIIIPFTIFYTYFAKTP